MINLFDYFKQLEKEDRVMFFLVLTTIGNIFIAIVKFVLSLTLPSLCFFINALFMIVLTFARYFSIRDYSKAKSIKDKDLIKKIGYKNYLNNRILYFVVQNANPKFKDMALR